MKKILFLTPRMPFPLIGGDRIKPYNLLKHLAKDNMVHLVTLYQGNDNIDELVAELKKINVEVTVIKLNPFLKSIYILLNILSSKPLEILYYYDSKFQRIVDKMIEKNNYDISFAFFMRTAEYLKNKSLPKVLIAEDCRTIYQERSYKESNSLPQKFIRWWDYRKLKNYEPKIMEKFDLVTLVSEFDVSEIQRISPKSNVGLLTNGTEIAKYKPLDNIEKKGLLFLGKLDIWANQMMIQKIVKNILPDIIKEFPETIFSIVGANPPKSISKLESKNIKIYPNVPEAIPYYQENLIFIHPHSGATGIQNKVLEAMSTAMAVVTTKTGNQGINAIDGKDMMIANDLNDFKKITLDLLRNKDKAINIGVNARNHIIATHSWESIFVELDKIIDKYAK